MPAYKSIGAIELSSIGIGYKIQDEMLKAASVELLIARTICSGKYLIVIGGSVSDVEAAIQTGLAQAGEAIIDHLILANVHESVFPALGQSVVLDSDHTGALGVGVWLLVGAWVGFRGVQTPTEQRGTPSHRSGGSVTRRARRTQHPLAVADPLRVAAGVGVPFLSGVALLRVRV